MGYQCSCGKHNDLGGRHRLVYGCDACNAVEPYSALIGAVSCMTSECLELTDEWISQFTSRHYDMHGEDHIYIVEAS